MNTELFIAKRILSGKENKKNISKTIVGIALIAISISLATIILSVGIIKGFKNEISAKVVGFGGHIDITNFDSNRSFETSPILLDSTIINLIKSESSVKSIQSYAIKPGIIKTKTDIHTIALKGIDESFDWEFFNKNIKEGSVDQFKDSLIKRPIIISKSIASKLKLKVNDKIAVYFIQDPPRIRPFTITGIYNTDLQNFDELIAITNISEIQKLNDWNPNQISGYEILLNDFSEINNTAYELYSIIGNFFYSDGSKLQIETILDKYPQIFDWLNLLDMNALVLIVLVLFVAGVNMISGLIVIILERINFIGILKAMGTSNSSIKKIFLYHSSYLIMRGLLWGNIIGIGIGALQNRFHFIKLDPESYYLSTVPVHFSASNLILINVGTMLAIILILVIPANIIARVHPSKAIRFT